jgi:hypothetical protein
MYFTRKARGDEYFHGERFRNVEGTIGICKIVEEAVVVRENEGMGEKKGMSEV